MYCKRAGDAGHSPCHVLCADCRQAPVEPPHRVAFIVGYGAQLFGDVKLDNIKPVSTATARSSSGKCSMPTRGDEILYRAMGTGVLFPATISAVRLDGTLDIEIQLPGVKDPFGRGRVKWSPVRSLEHGVCMPKET